jgi:uncharacterized protein YceK
MRRLVLAFMAAVALAGCASTLQGAYDEQRRTECERENYGRDRINCR